MDSSSSFKMSTGRWSRPELPSPFVAKQRTLLGLSRPNHLKKKSQLPPPRSRVAGLSTANVSRVSGTGTGQEQNDFNWRYLGQGSRSNLLRHPWFVFIEGGAAASCASFSSSTFVNCDVAKGPGGPGKGSLGQSSRIIGGTETKPHAYPSAVTLQQTDIDDGTLAHYCTAVLIHESWVSISSPIFHY